MNEKFKRPCLRWPGNKFSLLDKIIPLSPKKINTYHEPFLGSASVFLNLNILGPSYLHDCNPELINFYQQVKVNLACLLKELSQKVNSEEFFYMEREQKYSNPVERAAQLYYLNRTCFNGIYRINSKGIFNVPYGYRKSEVIVDIKALTYLSARLRSSCLETCDFSESLKTIKKNDFVYLDPPYSSKKKISNFLMYNEKLFGWDDQLRLQIFCEELIKKNVRFIMNNLYNEEVLLLFGKELNLKTITTERYSTVGSKLASRGLYKEYLFYNDI